MQEVEFPDELTPLNLRAYFVNAFGACGCSDLESMVDEVLRLLEWHRRRSDHDADRRIPWNEVYPTPGVFYLMAGLFDNLGLSEHGTAIRHPWLTRRGGRLLGALRAISAREIDDAQGEAYDGLWYGMQD